MKNRHGKISDLPKMGAKRYGHLSSKRPASMIRSLAKSNYFSDWVEKYKKYLGPLLEN